MAGFIRIEVAKHKPDKVAQRAIKTILDLILRSIWGRKVPANEFLNDAPPRAHLRMQLIQPLQLLLLPLIPIQLRVQEVDPLLPALNFAALVTFSPKLLRDALPSLRGELRIEVSNELNFLDERRSTSEDQGRFFLLPFINKIIRMSQFMGKISN